MTDLHATIIRIASRQPCTVRGLAMRVPAPRPDAERAVRELLSAGTLTLNDDGEVTTGPHRPRPKPQPTGRRNVKQAAIVALLRERPMTARQIAERLGRSRKAVELHIRNLVADERIVAVATHKPAGVTGYASRVWEIVT